MSEKDGYGREEKTVFRIYDMPSSVSMRLISYAKKNCGNKAWVAVDRLLDNANLQQKLDSLEERITKLEEQNGKIQ